MKTRKLTVEYSKNSNFVIRLIKCVVINRLSKLKFKIRNDFKTKRDDFVFVYIKQLNDFFDFFEKEIQILNIIKKSREIQYCSNIIHFFNFLISRLTILLLILISQNLIFSKFFTYDNIFLFDFLHVVVSTSSIKFDIITKQKRSRIHDFFISLSFMSNFRHIFFETFL